MAESAHDQGGVLVNLHRLSLFSPTPFAFQRGYFSRLRNLVCVLPDENG